MLCQTKLGALMDLNLKKVKICRRNQKNGMSWADRSKNNFQTEAINRTIR